MKRALLSVLLGVAAVGASAQEKGYLSVMPGHQFSGSYMNSSSFVASVDGGYFFNKTFGMHFGVLYNDKGFDWASFEIAEIGAEFAGQLGDSGQFYGQLNLGYTFGLSSNHTYLSPWGFYTVKRIDVWTPGAAVGYRYYFNRQVGLNIQAAYHQLGSGGEAFSDVRVGVIWKF